MKKENIVKMPMDFMSELRIMAVQAGKELDLMAIKFEAYKNGWEDSSKDHQKSLEKIKRENVFLKNLCLFMLMFILLKYTGVL